MPPPRSVTYAPTQPQSSPSKAADAPAAAPAAPAPVEPVPVPSTPAPAAEPVAPKPVPAAAPVPAQPAADLPPEGPAVPAASTAPELNLEPSASALQYPPTEPVYDAVPGQDQNPLTIYQVDIDSLPEKPWRRPGANMSDWFNYGFDETTWAMWCAQKNRMDQTRTDFTTILKDGAPDASADAPYAPPEVQDDAQNPMANLTAMFAPGMMGMPGMQWPMMQGMMPGAPDAPDAMGMMGMPPQGEGDAANMPSGWNSGHPLPPAPHLAQEDARGTDSDSRDAHGRSRRDRGPRSGSRRDRRRHDERSEEDDAYAPEHHPSAPRRDRYSDRDAEALDYGSHVPHDDDRRHRRSPARHDDDRHHDDAPRGSRDRPSRRERDRQRSDRRAGRGGQKRGAPEGDDHGDYAAKRFHGGRP